MGSLAIITGDGHRVCDCSPCNTKVHENFDSPIEFYNLSTGLGETNNVADANPEIVEQIQALLVESHKTGECMQFRSELEKLPS